MQRRPTLATSKEAPRDALYVFEEKLRRTRNVFRLRRVEFVRCDRHGERINVGARRNRTEARRFNQSASPADERVMDPDVVETGVGALERAPIGWQRRMRRKRSGENQPAHHSGRTSSPPTMD